MSSTRKAKVIPADIVFAKARKQPGYQAAYDALEEEFSIMSAMIRARTEAGMTQQQVADRMKTTQSAVARLETSTRTPSTDALKRYAEAVGHRLKISFERTPPKP